MPHIDYTIYCTLNNKSDMQKLCGLCGPFVALYITYPMHTKSVPQTMSYYLHSSLLASRSNDRRCEKLWQTNKSIIKMP